MAQAVIAYAIVAIAAVWIVWSIFIPRKVKAAIRARLRRG